MELRHLRYFVTLAEELHFARAAARLHIVQPALSMQIQSLEREFGTQLFDRSHRSVQLTPAGSALLPAARQCLKQAELARRAVADAVDGTAGRIRIGYSASAVYSDVLRACVTRLRSERPEITLSIEEIHPQTQVDALLDQDLDVVLSTTLAIPDTPGLVRRVLRRYPICLAMASTHPLAASGEAIPVSAIARESFVGYSGPLDTDGSILYQRVLGFEPRIVCRAESPIMVLGLVETGIGIAIVSGVLAARFPERIVYRAIHGIDLEMDVALIHRDESHRPSVNDFIEIALATAEPSPDG